MAAGSEDVPGQDDTTSRLMVRVPPKSGVLISLDGSGGGARIAIWELWLDLAERHAGFAWECRLSRPDLEDPDQDPDQADQRIAGSTEFEHTMLAVSAAAFAVDGLYGAVKGFVGAPRSSAARPRRILETLKHGFAVGAEAEHWRAELDWLFDLRDSIVHHADDYGPLKVVHETENLLVAIPAEAEALGHEAAARAARLAREIADTCRSRPKPVVMEWIRGNANWEPGPGETVRPGDIERRTFPFVRD